MADKPYRVYRGGRRSAGPSGDEPPLRLPPVDGADPAPADAAPVDGGRRRGPVVLPPEPRPVEPRRAPGPPAPVPRGHRAPGLPGVPGRRLGRIGRRLVLRVVLLVLSLLVAVLGVWVAIGYLAFRASVEQANRRLDARHPGTRAALAPQHGLLLSKPTTVLILGADRTGHSDSLQLVHTDPGRHLVSTLSLPRDLLVPIPGRAGRAKLNQAYAEGGAPLAVRTVTGLTGLRVNHAVIVDFAGFRGLVDALGGITIDSPEAIRSRFDGITYRFPKGRQTLDGRRALAYARVRKNALNPADSDVSRGVHQQQVLRAIRHELVSPRSLLRLRTIGRELAEPLATDMSANQILSLGWVDFRAQRKLTCNLGGTPSSIGGVAGIVGDNVGNRRVLDEFLGRVAVQVSKRPGAYEPACRRG